ncbi:MAG: hypothetical protein IJO32_02055 [Bacilli bacterium]|nr:hypothetical protein [Bacilli bacterium]
MNKNYIKNLDNNIETLCLEIEIIDKLHKLGLNTINDLWKSKRIYLKENGLTDNEINQIKIKLQLLSIDLNKKVYTQ